jgi:GMP synthase PP-ATPase subunit
MTRKEWSYVGVSISLIDVIDEFLKSEDAKSLNLKNRQQFVNQLIYNFFEKYKESTGIDYLQRPTITSIFDLIDSKSKKIKK